METAIRSESSVRFESFEFSPRTGELFRNGFRLKLRGHPTDVLAILLEHPGEVVTRETFQKRLWPENTFVDFEQILNNSIARLRDVLGDQAESPEFIETLPRLGYRFIAPVEKTSASNPPAETPNHCSHTPAAAPDLQAPQTARSGVHRMNGLWTVWPVTVLTVAIASLGYRYLRTPLPSPHITHYEQLTLDGRQKFPFGTDGTRIYLDLPGGGRSIGQIPTSGGRITEFTIDVPLGDYYVPGLHAVSPDGSSLLVMNQNDFKEGYKIWVVGALGHPARYLTRALRAAWSPGGKSIVYINPHGDIYTISANGGESRLLHREDAPVSEVARTRDMIWSPDGTTIRLSRWGGRMFEMSSSGTNFHEWLPGWNGSVQKCCGRWTPDGQFFVFLAGHTLAKAPGFPRLAQIWAVDERKGRMRPSIAEPVLLASEPLHWGDPIPSRDGKKIFVRGVSLRGELERYDPTSKQLEPYLGGISAEMPDFSRDGKYVAYVSFPEGILWRANRDGSGLMQLTEPPFYPRNPRWSPDGTQILFTDDTQNGVDAIYVVSSQGGTPKRLLPQRGEPESLADWSPDSKRVVYAVHPAFSSLPVDDAKIEVRIVELPTGRVTILPKGPLGFFAPLWSPDGRYIAGQAFEGRELHVYDLKTGRWNTLLHNVVLGYHNWSHDGRFIYFVRWRQDNIGVYRIPVQGGGAELVFDLPEGFRGTGWYDFWMSLDPNDAPLLLRDAGTDEIYALTLETK
jgi:Tol biopolymer transport system component/DNA-binding winged helix-turn-helix (wHTH) protein